MLLKRWTAVVVAAGGMLLLGGCTPDSYKDSADRDVKAILHNREETTLGYSPQVEAKTTENPTPGKAAYAMIPVTPVPPLTAPPISPVEIHVPYGQLGPENLPYVSPMIPGADAYGINAAERRAAENRELGPPDPTDRSVKLDLFRSIEYAVQHSRNYQSEMEDLFLTALSVTLERHLFAPRPFASTGVDYTGGQRAVRYRSALTAANTAGVRQQLPYGGEIVARTMVDFVDALESNVGDGESASAALTASIPLLRGAGMVNLEPLINSERQVIYQIRSFEDFRRQFLVQISTQYFNLLTRMQQLNNRRFNYTTLRGLTEQSQALYDAGRAKFIDVQRARQSELSALNDLIDAQERYQTALDTFKILLGMPIDTDLEIIAVELDVQVPKAQVSEVIGIATKYRLDLQTARDQVEDARRNVSNAKNGLLPELRFTADGTMRNPGDTSATHLNARESTYGAGLQLDLPIDRIAERNAYRRSLINLQRSERSYEELKDRISIAARDALRAIESAQMTVQIQALGIEVAMRRLDNSNELLRQGQVTSRDVVESQSSLLSAQDAYFQARAVLQIGILEYLRQTGTLRVDPEAGTLGQTMDRATLLMQKSTRTIDSPSGI